MPCMKILAMLVLIASLAAAEPAHPSLPGPVIPDGVGVNIHFTDAQPGEMEMLAAAGFRWVRMDFVWSATERERGRYDFAAYDRLMQSLDAHSMRALLILDYGNALYEPENAVATDAGRQAFARWAAAAAAHFKGRGILWEIWNEPNIDVFWKPTADVRQYAALALAAARAIRAAAPGEAIIGPATSGMDFRFLEECFKAGLLEWWDAVSVHPYRRSDPESAAVDYAKLQRLIARYAPANKTIPILSSEWGYSSAWKGFDQDKMLARQWLTNLANRIPLSIWYDWHDDGADPNNDEDHYGTVALPYHSGRDPVYDPKPAWRAAKTLTTVLGGCRFAKQLATGRPDDFAVLFERAGQVRLALWTTSRQPHEVTLPSSPGSFELVSHVGERRGTVTVQGDSFTLTATDAPQYLLFNGPNPALADAPAIHPLRATVSPVMGMTLVVHVENLVDAAFKGRARLVETDGLEPVAAEQSLEFAASEAEATLRFPIAAKPSRAYSFGLRIESADGSLILDLSSRCYTAVPDEVLTDCKIFADGDAKVGSELSVAVAPAPEPLPGSESPALKVTYRMDAGWKFLRLAPERADLRAIAGEPKAFGMWIYGNGGQTSPRLRVTDSNGQCWQPIGDEINWTGWRFVEFDLSPATDNWGGVADNAIHFPLKWDSVFLLDKSREQQAQGIIYLTAPVVIY
ncbi:MAG: cellulase family glycosylhydrolase [Candidatus Brocadiia bacterium]